MTIYLLNYSNTQLAITRKRSQISIENLPPCTLLYKTSEYKTDDKLTKFLKYE